MKADETDEKGYSPEYLALLWGSINAYHEKFAAAWGRSQEYITDHPLVYRGVIETCLSKLEVDGWISAVDIKQLILQFFDEFIPRNKEKGNVKSELFQRIVKELYVDELLSSHGPVFISKPT